MKIKQDTILHWLEHAKWAELAYKNPREIKAVLPGAVTFEVGPNAGYIAPYGDGDAILSYPGTNDLGDFKKDLTFFKTGWYGNLAHSGFVKYQQSLWVHVDHVMREISPKVVHVAAHSLGAAAGSLAAFEMANNYEFHGVTFGEPRVYDDENAKVFNQRVPNWTRLLNDMDPVPSLPPDVFGFDHEGKGVRIKNGRFRKELEWWMTLIKWVKIAQTGDYLEALDNGQDHKITDYIRELETIAGLR